MLKCNMNRKKDLVKVKCNGTPSELATETMAIVSAVFAGLDNQSPEAAEDYKRIIQAFMIDPKSPVFKKGSTPLKPI